MAYTQQILNLSITPRLVALGESVVVECDVRVNSAPYVYAPIYLLTGATTMIPLGKTDGLGHLLATWVPGAEFLGTRDYWVYSPAPPVAPGDPLINEALAGPISLQVYDPANVVADLRWVSGRLT